MDVFAASFPSNSEYLSQDSRAQQKYEALHAHCGDVPAFIDGWDHVTVGCCLQHPHAELPSGFNRELYENFLSAEPVYPYSSPGNAHDAPHFASTFETVPWHDACRYAPHLDLSGIHAACAGTYAVEHHHERRIVIPHPPPVDTLDILSAESPVFPTLSTFPSPMLQDQRPASPCTSYKHPFRSPISESKYSTLASALMLSDAPHSGPVAHTEPSPTPSHPSPNPSASDGANTPSPTSSPIASSSQCSSSQGSQTLPTPGSKSGPKAPTSSRRQRSATRSSHKPLLPNNGKCPKCDYVQRTERPQELRRHIRSHDKAVRWICCGIPFDRAKDYGLPPTVIARERFEHAGIQFVGGCGKTFSRRDSLQRHLKNVSTLCYGDPLGSWQPGNREEEEDA